LKEGEREGEVERGRETAKIVPVLMTVFLFPFPLPRYHTSVGSLKGLVLKQVRWADVAVVTKKIEDALAAMLGPRTAADDAPPPKEKGKKEKKEGAAAAAGAESAATKAEAAADTKATGGKNI
jgi:hypothetical protein